MSNIAAVWRSDLAAAMVVCWLSSGGVGDLRRSRYFADRISYNSSRQPCCTSLIYIEMDQFIISGLCTFKFQVKSSNFLELWFTACSLWTALEMFFWKNIGNLLYLDPLSTTSSTLRYLFFPSVRSPKDDFCVFAEQGDQPNWHPAGHCNTPSLSHLNIQVNSWYGFGTYKVLEYRLRGPDVSYSFLFSRSNIFFVAVCMTEVPPLFVIEFLHRVVDTMEDYFSECSETIIKDNYVVVYEVVLKDSFLKIFYDAWKVLDEMLDNGFPLATEANILKELIKPPNMLRDVVNSGWLQIHH